MIYAVRFGFLVLILLSVSGCGNQIEDFVRSGDKRETPATPDLFGNRHGYKLSPGANQVAGSQVKSQFAITPTQRTVKGTAVQSTFSIQSQRVE